MRYVHFEHDEPLEDPLSIYEEGGDSPYGWMDHAIGRSAQHIRNQIGMVPGGIQMEEKFHEALWQQTASIWFLGTELSRIRIILENLQNVSNPLDRKGEEQ